MAAGENGTRWLGLSGLTRQHIRLQRRDASLRRDWTSALLPNHGKWGETGLFSAVFRSKTGAEAGKSVKVCFLLADLARRVYTVSLRFSDIFVGLACRG